MGSDTELFQDIKKEKAAKEAEAEAEAEAAEVKEKAKPEDEFANFLDEIKELDALASGDTDEVEALLFKQQEEGLKFKDPQAKKAAEEKPKPEAEAEVEAEAEAEAEEAKVEAEVEPAEGKDEEAEEEAKEEAKEEVKEETKEETKEEEDSDVGGGGPEEPVTGYLLRQRGWRWEWQKVLADGRRFYTFSWPRGKPRDSIPLPDILKVESLLLVDSRAFAIPPGARPEKPRHLGNVAGFALVLRDGQELVFCASGAQQRSAWIAAVEEMRQARQDVRQMPEVQITAPVPARGGEGG
ncbi:unnamed protein product [Effrenium voratum]|nr:unnamed protein product [Effrenium voratum]